jgi:hypothetical protein
MATLNPIILIVINSKDCPVKLRNKKVYPMDGYSIVIGNVKDKKQLEIVRHSTQIIGYGFVSN